VSLLHFSLHIVFLLFISQQFPLYSFLLLPSDFINPTIGYPLNLPPVISTVTLALCFSKLYTRAHTPLSSCHFLCSICRYILSSLFIFSEPSTDATFPHWHPRFFLLVPPLLHRSFLIMVTNGRHLCCILFSFHSIAQLMALIFRVPNNAGNAGTTVA
jgi:hypothetical protein